MDWSKCQFRMSPIYMDTGYWLGFCQSIDPATTEIRSLLNITCFNFSWFENSESVGCRLLKISG